MKATLDILAKAILFLAAAGLVAAVAPPAESRVPLEQVLQRAMQAERAGELDEARQLTQRIFVVQPNHFATRELATRLERAEAAREARAARDLLRELIIEEVRFEEVSLADAVNFLRRRTEETEVNFVIIDPQGNLRGKVINELVLTRVPVTVVIEYIGEMLGLSVEYQQRSVILRARE